MKKNVFGYYEEKKYRQWRAAEGICSLFCLFGIIIAGIDYETGYSSERTHDNCKENPNPIHRILILVFSVVSVLLLFLRHYLKSEWYSMQSNVSYKKRKSFLSIKLILELLVILIFPYPGLSGSFSFKQSLLTETSEARDNRISMCYTYSELLYFFTHFRIFFIFRTFLNYTPYQDKHARAHCELNNTKANLRFSVKSMIQSHPLLMIMLSVFPSFFLFGSFLRIFERPFTDISGKNYDSIQNAAWNSFITMSTIGYGELYPSTFPGRAVAVLCTMWGAYAFSMMIFTMQKALELNANQVRALTTIKLTRTAGKVIAWLLAYAVSRKKGLSGTDEWTSLKQALKRFRFNMRKIKSLKRKIGFKETISKHKIQELAARLKVLNEKVNLLTTAK